MNAIVLGGAAAVLPERSDATPHAADHELLDLVARLGAAEEESSRWINVAEWLEQRQKVRREALDWANGEPLLDAEMPGMERLRGACINEGGAIYISPGQRASRGDVERINRAVIDAATRRGAAPRELARLAAEGRDRIRWWQRARQRQRSALAASERIEAREDARIAAAWERHELAKSECDAAEKGLKQSRARTLQGLIAKMATALEQANVDEDGGFGEELLYGVFADLKAMASS
jgi:hypothetical protein